MKSTALIFLAIITLVAAAATTNTNIIRTYKPKYNPYKSTKLPTSSTLSIPTVNASRPVAYKPTFRLIEAPSIAPALTPTDHKIILLKPSSATVPIPLTPLLPLSSPSDFSVSSSFSSSSSSTKFSSSSPSKSSSSSSPSKSSSASVSSSPSKSSSSSSPSKSSSPSVSSSSSSLKLSSSSAPSSPSKSSPTFSKSSSSSKWTPVSPSKNASPLPATLSKTRPVSSLNSLPRTRSISQSISLPKSGSVSPSKPAISRSPSSTGSSSSTTGTKSTGNNSQKKVSSPKVPTRRAPVRYSYAYDVKDSKSNVDFGHQESRNGDDTTGRYNVVLPDGRRQIVNYYSNKNLGYVADVTYEGEVNISDSASNIDSTAI